MGERRNHLTLVGLILAALFGAILLAVPASPAYQKPVLGLDLQGGLEVVLQAVPPEGRSLSGEDLDRSVEIMRDRVDKLGVTEPEIRKQGDDQIVIQLPGIRDPAQAAELIGKTAKLELFDLETSLTGPSINVQGFPVPNTSIYDLLGSAGVQARAERGKPAAFYLFEQKTKKLVSGPVRSRAALLRKSGGEVPKGHKVFAVPEGQIIVQCGVGEVVCPGVNQLNPTTNFFYLFKYEPNAEKPVPQMTGENLELGGTRQDFDTQSGEAIVLMQFTDRGADIFHDITREEATRGRFRHSQLGQGGDTDSFNQHFAIVLDREIKSFPSIDFVQYPDGISGNNGAQITGIGSVNEAKDLALVLQTGALPVEFKTLEQTQISATLGEDSLNEAVRAALAGLAVVAVFLLVFYRFLGLVAVFGLAIYAMFLYAAILIFDVTLTLPGFAGMILTIGVAADANVVIFERIKEESRAGRSVRAAIAAGYSKGFSTIIDANVVTAITALVLFALATAQVRGFALFLLIGTAISIITAVFATRAMLALLAGFAWFDSPAFMGAQAQKTAKWLQIDFMGKRRVWFAMSAVILVVGVASLGAKGLNLGIDFEGGTQVTFNTAQPVALSDVRNQAGEIGRGDAVIQGRGAELSGQRYRNFQIRTESLDQAQQRELTRAIEREFGATSVGVKNVSASFGRQIAEGAIWAVAISFLLMFIYIWFRFHGWKFAVPVLAAVAHDTLLTVGIYSVSGREMTTATVAAILTVLGYSMYDTIIIFDRIRENIPLMRRATFGSITNVSIWETIVRSMATTFITLLPVTALVFFGGETLKDFAFALLIGIGSGAYSTIFIAAPILTMLKQREPEYARRRTGELGKEEPGDEGEAPARPAPRPPSGPQIGRAHV